MPSVRILNPSRFFLLAGLVFFFGAGQLSFAAQEKWQKHKTLHYIIFYEEAPESFINNLGEEAEDLFGDTADQMGFENYPPWRKNARIKIYVYNDRDHYEAGGRGNRREGTRAMAHVQKRAISTFTQDRDSFLNATLPHELAHIFFWEYVGVKADVPGWFAEGIAMMREKRDQQEREDFIRRLLEDRDYFSLEDIPLAKHTDLDYYYPVAYSATKYLLSRVQGNKLSRLFDLLKEGKSFEKALSDVTNGNIPTIERLSEDWVEAVKEEGP